MSVVTVAELRAGVLAAGDLGTPDRRLATLSEALALDPTPIDGAVADAWARLRIALRDTHQTMPVNDSWIAATAVSLAVPVVTHDDYYVEVPGLSVIGV